MIAPLVCALCLSPLLAIRSPEGSFGSWELFPSGADFYNYTPCSIEDDAHHFWWCQNTDPGSIVDHIYYRRFDLDAKRWTARELALAPGERGRWDSRHVCDPAVVRGEFHHGGARYEYALAYLGTDVPDCTHNQIGLAFAARPEGPWVRYDRNPIVEGSANTWGVGQPSLVSLDKRGRVLLFYTRQHEDESTHTYVSEAQLRDMAKPVIGKPTRVTVRGLTDGPGADGVVLHDADFAYDPTTDSFVVVRPQRPYQRDGEGRECSISSYLQVARIEADGLRSGVGRWTVIGRIGPESTGFAHNHNAAIARTPYGAVTSRTHVRINLSVACRADAPLWSYTLHAIVLPLS